MVEPGILMSGIFIPGIDGIDGVELGGLVAA
jgi:hypothetical protein